jgi:ketosteroid isomerase-like protein
MSAKDVETIREGIAALNRGDLDAMIKTLDPDVELIPLRALLDGTTYRGHDGMRQWMDDIAEDWTQYQLTLDEVRQVRPGRVLVRAHMHLRGRSGVEVDNPGLWVCDLKASKVARIQFFTDLDAALAAAGA